MMGLSIRQNGGGWNEALAGRCVVYDLADAAIHAGGTTERLRAIESLGKTDDPRAVRPLMEVLTDTEPAIRLAATMALGHLRSGRPVDDLIGRLRDRDEQEIIRRQAILTLATIRSTGALRGLRDFAADEEQDEDLRSFISSLFKEMNPL